MASNQMTSTSSISYCTSAGLSADCTQCLKDVLMWKNKTTTSAYLAIINLIFFLVFVMSKSLISICCHIFLFFMLLGFVFKLIDTSVCLQENEKATNAIGNAKIEIINREAINNILMCTYDIVNEYVSLLRDIVMWRDTIFSLKVWGIVFAFGFVCSYVALPTFCFVLVWILFSFTFFLDLYNSYIQEHVHFYIAQIHKFTLLAFSSIPKMDDLKKK